MALKLKYTDERGILHINMSPTSATSLPRVEPAPAPDDLKADCAELTDPKFDTINNRFGPYDLFGAKYDDSGGSQSLFRSRYNSIEEELANTPYAFATDRCSLRVRTDSPLLDITIRDNSPSKDIEDNRFFRRGVDGLFGPEIDFKTSDEDETPAFTVTQLIHAQDRYFDLSSRSPKNKTLQVNSNIKDSKRDLKETKATSDAKKSKSSLVVRTRSEPSSARKERTVTIVDGEREEAFRVLPQTLNKQSATVPVVPISKRSREKSFAILTETPLSSRPSSPHSLPVEITIRSGRISPFRGRSFREDTSRHSTPKTSAANSRASSPSRRRTSSLSRVDDMAAATMPPPSVIHTMSRPHSPRNFVKQNIEEVRELSELNREIHEAEAEHKRVEQEVALLKEMGLIDKNAKSDAIKSVVCSSVNSRSNSPNKLKHRSRSTSPTTVTAPSAILHYENIAENGKEYINGDDGMPKPAVRKSRVRSLSRSQPQSNDTSPKHSKIPKRQGSVSPARETKSDYISKRPLENNLRNQRFISNSTSSIHESSRLGHMNGRRGISKSTQLLNIAPAHIKGKPPISPGRVGPPPTNRAINPKRLSPIVGTPNKSPTDDKSRTPVKASPIVRKPVKAPGNTPATSRFNSRQPIKTSSREPSPDKRRPISKSIVNRTVNSNNATKPVSRTVSTKTAQKPTVTKVEPKKAINRTNSMKSLVRTLSAKALNDKTPALKKKDDSKDFKAQSTSKINEVGTKGNGKKSPTQERRVIDEADKNNTQLIKEESKGIHAKTNYSSAGDEVLKQDNETQYDKVTNEKGEIVILTKKNVVSMTTAAITSQPLEVVTTVTNQLPAALEKAREKAMLERNSSKDSLGPKDEITAANDDKPDERKVRAGKILTDDNVKLKPLLPPYNDPQVQRVKQKIDDLLTTTPEVSSENIVATALKLKENAKNTFKNVANQKKNEIRDSKNENSTKFANLKDQVVKQNEIMTAEIRSEASKIVDSIITPIEEPKDLIEKAKDDIKMGMEPIVMVVNEQKSSKGEVMEKIKETLVKGEPDVEVQSSSLSTPGLDKNKIAVQNMRADGSGSDKSAQSNGVFPQSTSTTPKPPARTHRKDPSKETSSHASKETTPQSDKDQKKPNICSRLMGKCKTKCCPCCIKPELDEDENGAHEMEAADEGKGGMLSKFNCCKKKEKDMEMEIAKAPGKVKTPSIEFENETQRKRKIRDVLCGCCGRRRRVSDVSDIVPRRVGDVSMSNDVADDVAETGCCGKRRVERRDSILSDRPPSSCCDNRLTRWVRGACRRAPPEPPASRRPSMFSKNKSLSPTLPPEMSFTPISNIYNLKSPISGYSTPLVEKLKRHSRPANTSPRSKPNKMSNSLEVPSVSAQPSPSPSRKRMKISTDLMKKDIDMDDDFEDTRTKLDPSLVEHTSVMRGAIPVLPPALAYFCLFCNILVPGLGTIFSGIFCLCFGIPRFGVHDGAKHRIGSFLINLVVGCGQLFCLLFCLVGWGWSIWWGTIMVKIARKYRKLKAELEAEEAENAPPVTANNHTRA